MDYRNYDRGYAAYDERIGLYDTHRLDARPVITPPWLISLRRPRSSIWSIFPIAKHYVEPAR